LLWIIRILWLLLPLGVGELLSEALTNRSSPVVVVVAVMSWGVWSVVLGALLFPLPATLTVIRLLAPVPILAGTISAVLATPSALGWFGLVTAAAALAGVMSAEVGNAFVNGASYGDERRFTLRAPAVVALAAAPLVWLVTVIPAFVAPLLLAAKAWVLGGIVAVVATLAAPLGWRILSRLARRWLVFVPAGITVVDSLTLAESVLFPARDLQRLGPAHEGSPATDLTAGATGLVLQIDVSAPMEIVPTVRRGATANPVSVNSVLISPSRPGEVLSYAESRKLRVKRE